jgi:hypothetical protein
MAAGGFHNHLVKRDATNGGLAQTWCGHTVRVTYAGKLPAPKPDKCQRCAELAPRYIFSKWQYGVVE